MLSSYADFLKILSSRNGCAIDWCVS